MFFYINLSFLFKFALKYGIILRLKCFNFKKEEREEDVGIREVLESFKKSSKGVFLLAQW